MDLWKRRTKRAVNRIHNGRNRRILASQYHGINQSSEKRQDRYRNTPLSRKLDVRGWCYLELQQPQYKSVDSSALRSEDPLPTCVQSSFARILADKFGTGQWGGHCVARSLCSLETWGGLLNMSRIAPEGQP